MKYSLQIIVIFLIIAGFFFYRSRNQFELPSGDTKPIDVETEINDTNDIIKSDNSIIEGDLLYNETKKSFSFSMPKSTRQIFETNGVKHSIPLSEILSGGPSKDGIPSIDSPKFISTKEADKFLTAKSVGLGINLNGEARFYPYQILVWHEIVNDTVLDTPILVTYCPLCATGIVFERKVDNEVREFGVSGKLWQSNLLMYDRAGNEKVESLWSQVLGEAVLGPKTGVRLSIISSDTVMYENWKKKYPNTKILSKETGLLRNYALDPYGDYYTNESVSFGASFSDTRLHPKTFVLGIEFDEQYKAYNKDALPEGTTTDFFLGKAVRIIKDDIDGVRIFIDGNDTPYVGGFWFSWLAAHPDTKLYQ